MADDGRTGRDPRDPYVVDPERARDGRRSVVPMAVLGVIAVAVVALSAWGVLNPPPPSPSPLPPTARPSSAVGSATPEASGAPRGDAVALADLAAVAGWADCPIWRDFGTGAAVGPDVVASERSRQGIAAGPLVVDDLPGGTATVWLAGDADAAVRALGGTASVRDGDAVWTAIAPEDAAPVAIKLAPSVLRDGTVYWQERGRAIPAPYCFGATSQEPVTVIEVGATVDALGRLFRETGLDLCRTWQRMETAEYPSGAEVDRSADAAGLGVDAPGWVVVPWQPGYGERRTRVWVGADPAVAAAHHGASTAVVQAPDPSVDGDPARAWLAVRLDGRPAAIQMRVVETPAGRRAWLPTPNVAGVVGSCATESDLTRGAGGGDVPVAGPAGPTVELLRGGTDALSMLIEHLGWTGCRISGSSGMDDSRYRAVIGRLARTADGSIASDGWLTIPAGDPADPARAWLGDDLVALAHAADVTVVASEGSAAVWLADPTRAMEWRAAVTPGGRTAWIPTGAVTSPDAPCPGTAGAPDTLEGVRSLTCWTDRDRCLEAARAAMRAAPDAFTPWTEVAAGLGGTCAPATRCPWVGPDIPIIVTATPPGWTSSADVRAFSVGGRRPARPVRELLDDEITAGVLAMASRPSRALPTAPDGDPGAGYCPASGITGELRGSPWDDRVAWIGPNTVRWPHGFTARFMPGLELVAPEGSVYRAGDLVQASGLAGDEPVFVACRIAGTSGP